MVQAISSPVPAAGSASSGPSAASLRAQLQRFQQQLSDCVNCASAKTPEGKTAIREAAAKVSQVTQRLDALQNTRRDQGQASFPVNVPGSTTAGTKVNASGQGVFGNVIDVYA
jgi:hypothetical protein